MRFSHTSDNHGFFPDLQSGFDFVVHSGDIFPYSNNGRDINKDRTKRQREIDFQRNWIARHFETIHEWLQKKPLLYCAGNHDFFNPCELLNDLGVETIDLTNRIVEYAGYKWYGFPYVNYLDGEWNWELDQGELYQKTQWMINKIAADVDILVAHNPPYGVLDNASYNEHIGNNFIQSTLEYRKTAIRLMLFGHCHEDPGFVKLDEMDLVVSNAAGISNIIENIEGEWRQITG